VRPKSGGIISIERGEIHHLHDRGCHWEKRGTMPSFAQYSSPRTVGRAAGGIACSTPGPAAFEPIRSVDERTLLTKEGMGRRIEKSNAPIARDEKYNGGEIMWPRDGEWLLLAWCVRCVWSDGVNRITRTAVARQVNTPYRQRDFYKK
jgi:hypothetical protein